MDGSRADGMPMLAWLFVSLVEGNRCVSVGPRTRHLDASFFSADGVMVEPQPLARGSDRRIWIVVKSGRYDVPESRLASRASFRAAGPSNTSEGRGRSDPEIPVAAKRKNQG